MCCKDPFIKRKVFVYICEVFLESMFLDSHCIEFLPRSFSPYWQASRIPAFVAPTSLNVTSDVNFNVSSDNGNDIL